MMAEHIEIKQKLPYRLNNKGISILPFIIVISMVLFIGQQFLMMDQQNNFKNLLITQSLEAQKSLFANLSDLVAEELALRNSRFNTNSKLYQCLFATPSPCNEIDVHDMTLFSPNPPVTYSGGAWPAPPAGIAKIAGGLNTMKVLYTRSAGICPSSITEPDPACPLQAIIQFKVLCGGTPMDPQPQAILGLCPGPANGFDITIGVGVYKNGNFTFKNDISNYGDAKIYRIRATTLLN